MAGVAINPATPLTEIMHVLEKVDMVLIMTVNPGFGAQKFIEHSLDKVRRLRQMITASGSQALIEVDGGVNRKTVQHLATAGVDVFVTGSAVFGAEEPVEEVRILKDLIAQA